MNATLLYRIAAVLLVLFAVGHTFGFWTFRPPSAEGMAVLQSMDRVHFEVGGRSYSYGAWYRGFGLSITAAMLFWAFLSWHLGQMARVAPQTIRLLGWAFFLVQCAGLLLAAAYLVTPAIVFSSLITALAAVGAWLTPRT
jgi:hypothetical protein